MSLKERLAKIQKPCVDFRSATFPTSDTDATLQTVTWNQTYTVNTELLAILFRAGDRFPIVQENSERGAHPLLRLIGAMTPREAAQRRAAIAGICPGASSAGTPRAALRGMGKRGCVHERL
jgi:hypothetical protein